MTMARSGLRRVGFGDQLVKQAPDLRQMAENFRDADDSEVFGVDHGVATRGPHAVPAHAEEFELLICVVAGDSPARRRKASISCAPYISPEASPAEIRIRTEAIVTKRSSVAPASRRLSRRRLAASLERDNYSSILPDCFRQKRRAGRPPDSRRDAGATQESSRPRWP